jgi:hypothetical protein
VVGAPVRSPDGRALIAQGGAPGPSLPKNMQHRAHAPPPEGMPGADSAWSSSRIPPPPPYTRAGPGPARGAFPAPHRQDASSSPTPVTSAVVSPPPPAWTTWSALPALRDAISAAGLAAVCTVSPGLLGSLAEVTNVDGEELWGGPDSEHGPLHTYLDAVFRRAVEQGRVQVCSVTGPIRTRAGETVPSPSPSSPAPTPATGSGGESVPLALLFNTGLFDDANLRIFAVLTRVRGGGPTGSFSPHSSHFPSSSSSSSAPFSSPQLGASGGGGAGSVSPSDTSAATWSREMWALRHALSENDLADRRSAAMGSLRAALAPALASITGAQPHTHLQQRGSHAHPSSPAPPAAPSAPAIPRAQQPLAVTFHSHPRELAVDPDLRIDIAWARFLGPDGADEALIRTSILSVHSTLTAVAVERRRAALLSLSLHDTVEAAAAADVAPMPTPLPHMTRQQLGNRLRAGLIRAVSRAAMDHRNTVPGFDPETKAAMLLLPLPLALQADPDAERTQQGTSLAVIHAAAAMYLVRDGDGGGVADGVDAPAVPVSSPSDAAQSSGGNSPAPVRMRYEVRRLFTLAAAHSHARLAGRVVTPWLKGLSLGQPSYLVAADARGSKLLLPNAFSLGFLPPSIAGLPSPAVFSSGHVVGVGARGLVGSGGSGGPAPPLGPAGSGSFVPPLSYAQPHHGGFGGGRRAVQQQQQQQQQHPPGANAHISRHSQHGHSGLADDRGSATGSGGSVASSSRELGWGHFWGSASVGFQRAGRAGSGGGSQYGAHQSRRRFAEEGPIGSDGTGTIATEPWVYSGGGAVDGGGGWGEDDASSVASSSLIHGSASEYAASVYGARGGGGRVDNRVDGGHEPYPGGFSERDATASMALQEEQRQQQQSYAGSRQSSPASFGAWPQGHGGSADFVQVAPWGSTGTAAEGASAAATATVWGGGGAPFFQSSDDSAGTGALNMNILHLGARGAPHAASGDGRGVGAPPPASLGFLGGTQGQVADPQQARQGLSAQQQRSAPPGLTAGSFAGLLGSLGARPDDELTGIADDGRGWRRSGDGVDEGRASGASSATPRTPPGLSALLAEPNWGSSGPARTGTGGGHSPTGAGGGQTASSVVSRGSGASAPPFGGHVDLGLPLSSMDPTRAKELATAALRLLPRGGGR